MNVDLQAHATGSKSADSPNHVRRKLCAFASLYVVHERAVSRGVGQDGTHRKWGPERGFTECQA